MRLRSKTRATFPHVPLVLGIVLPFVFACSIGKDPGAVAGGTEKSVVGCIPGTANSVLTAPAGSTADVAAFSSTAYAALTGSTMRCNTCHSITGPGTPFFAQSTAAASFPIAMSEVNWADLSTSALVSYSSNNHCGEPDKCGGNSSAMLTALQAWASAELSAGAIQSSCPTAASNTGATKINGYYVTPALSYPTGLSTAFVTISFPLDAQGFKGASFSMQVQMVTPASATSNATYRFKRPRILTSNPIHVVEIHLFVNGSEPPGFTQYLDVDNVVFETSGAMLSPLLSTPMVGDKVGGGDQIQFGFQVLESAPAIPTCKNLALFTTNVYGSTTVAGTMQSSCITCHGTKTGAGFIYFNMSGTAADVCPRALERITKSDPLNSSLVRNPQGFDGHTTVSGFNPASFAAWVQSEL